VEMLDTYVLVAAYLGAGFAVGFGAIGAALGEGYCAGYANRAVSRRPTASGDIIRNMLVGQAIAESAAIFALVVSILLIFMKHGAAPSIPKAAALLGAGICMGLGAIGSGIGSGLPAAGACQSLSYDPKMGGVLTRTMLIGSAVCQTPAIFSMVIAFMLMFSDFTKVDVAHKWAALIGAGLSMGFGAIGSGIGSGYPAGGACQGIVRQPKATDMLTTNMLVGSAVCQTPAIFAMVVAFMLMFGDFSQAPTSPTWAALLGAGFSCGLAAIGSGIGGGMAAGASSSGIARQPLSFGVSTTTMLVGQAVAQTPAIFGLLVSFILMFKTFPASTTWAVPFALLSAGVCMGFGGIGPGIGNGITAQGAVAWISRNSEAAGVLTRTMLVGQAVAQSTAIYAMVVALVLIFVV